MSVIPFPGARHAPRPAAPAVASTADLLAEYDRRIGAMLEDHLLRELNDPAFRKSVRALATKHEETRA